MRPENPIYLLSNVPYVLALAMGTIYCIVTLVVIGKTWLHRPRRRFLTTTARPATLAHGDAVVYAVTGGLWSVTAAVIHHHAGAPALTWLGILLWLHVIFTFWSWGMLRTPPLDDVIVITMVSTNLALYIGTKLFTPFVPWLNLGQSITMYVIQVMLLLYITWDLIGPRRRARVARVLHGLETDRYQECLDRSRSRGT